MKVRVRDFIYMDVERLKSIVAQVEEGLAESLTRTKGAAHQAGGGVEGGLFGVLKGGADVKALWENREAETRSLHDYLYNKVESALIEHDLLMRIPGDVEADQIPGGDASTWLPETAFFLAHGRVSINDFAHMKLVLDNMNAIAGFIAQCTSFSTDAPLSPKKKKEIERITQEQLRLDSKLVKGFQVFLDTFYKGRVVIKMMPFHEHPSFRLVGNLNKLLLRDDIDSIIYKYSTSPVGSWTIFGQVASIPPESGSSPMPVSGGGDIEQALHAFFDALRGIEVQAQSVIYPEVAITPIAIYRE
jgi:hypothetical protein